MVFDCKRITDQEQLSGICLNYLNVKDDPNFSARDLQTVVDRLDEISKILGEQKYVEYFHEELESAVECKIMTSEFA